MELDIIQIITGTSPTVGIAIYCIYQMRIDRIDALRREMTYSDALRADRAEQMSLMRDMVESTVRTERLIHELKNIMQTLMLDRRESVTTRSKGED